MICMMNSLLSRRPRGLYLSSWPSPVTGFSGNMLMQEFLACFRSFDNVPSTQVGASPGQWITIWCSTCTFSADPRFWVRLRCSRPLCNANGFSPILHDDSACTGIKVIHWNGHVSVNTPRVSWWFFGGNNLVNFLVRKLTLIHDACFLVIFPWQQPLAPRHWNDHGSVKTPRAWSGNGAGTKRERSGNEADSMISTFFSRFSMVFLTAASLPLRSRFTPAFFFSCFLTFFTVFPFFWGVEFLNIFLTFRYFYVFSWTCLVFFWKW